MRIMSWEELAVAVRARRNELGLTQAEVASRAGFSVERIRNLETMRRIPKTRMMQVKQQGLERALSWEHGSVSAILDGGVATPLATTTDLGNAPASADTSTPDQAPDDRFALARQIVSFRTALTEHKSAMTAEARQALIEEMAKSAREVEEAIVRMMPWLSDTDRGEAIDLLVKLRQP